MICLAYFSSAVTPPEPTELAGILKVSRRNNAASGVTGLLCHYDGSFLQFLEGEREAVEATFDRIAADPRHRGILRVHCRPIAARAFSDWSMGLVEPSTLGHAQEIFCRRLGEIAISADARHRDAIEPFLDSFRTWVR